MATLSELQTRRDNAYAALDSLIAGEAQSYTTPTGQTFTALQLNELRAYIDWLDAKIASLTPGGRRNYTARGRVR